MMFSHSRTRTQYVVLPPPEASITEVFKNVTLDNDGHEELMAEMQRFRGRIYGEDGAVRAEELTPDGRHLLEIDDHSWHILAVDGSGRICACLRYCAEDRSACFDDLWVRNAAITDSEMGRMFRRAVEREMFRARRLGMSFVEVGGWAVDAERRNGPDALRIILASYGLAQLLGGCVGVATATFRHASSSILRRIGLSSLTIDDFDLPPYFDPHYGCQMEVLSFDSRLPNPKYRGQVQELRSALTTCRVICREDVRVSVPELVRIEMPLRPAFESISAA